MVSSSFSIKKSYFTNSLCILLLLLFTISSCNMPPFFKSQYLAQYDSFMADVEKNAEDKTFDWKQSDEQFKKYSREYFESFKKELSEEEQGTVSKHKRRYLWLKTKNKGLDLLEKAEDLLLENTN